jgi:hypothetical protein
VRARTQLSDALSCGSGMFQEIVYHRYIVNLRFELTSKKTAVTTTEVRR